jgi:hypothetical protein
MSRNRIAGLFCATAVAVVAAAPVAHAQGDPLTVAAHLQVRAGADTAAAQAVAHRSAARARRLMAKGAGEMQRAAALVSRADVSTDAQGPGAEAVVSAQLALSQSASDQAATLSAIAGESSGRVKAAAVRALARVRAVKARLDAALASLGASGGNEGTSVEANASAGADGSTGVAGGLQVLVGLGGGGGR